MLAETHAQLDAHFLSLSRQRTATRYPVYTLTRTQPPKSNFYDNARARVEPPKALSVARWLLSVVVATEIGYACGGMKYEEAFAQRYLTGRDAAVPSDDPDMVW